MILAHHGLLMGGGAGGAGGATCPDYSTVKLQFTTVSYSPPNAGDGSAVLTYLPCPYTPPTVV